MEEPVPLSDFVRKLNELSEGSGDDFSSRLAESFPESGGDFSPMRFLLIRTEAPSTSTERTYLVNIGYRGRVIRCTYRRGEKMKVSRLPAELTELTWCDLPGLTAQVERICHKAADGLQARLQASLPEPAEDEQRRFMLTDVTPELFGDYRFEVRVLCAPVRTGVGLELSDFTIVLH